MKKISLIIIATVALLTSCTDNLKIGYVENYKLYSEFDLTNELDVKLQNFSDSRTRELDSLTMIFNDQTTLFEQLDEIPQDEYRNYTDLRNAIVFRQKSYEEDLYTLTQDYEATIWERLNGYIKTYAEENNYEFILGANGAGGLMYAKESTNVTIELTEYCNSKFKGEEIEY